MEHTTLSLKEQYETFKTENPKIRIRDAAKQLGVSEAELVATGDHNTTLRPEFRDILKEIGTLGYVMALTRNDHAVHERKGVYTKARFHGKVGLVVNPDIDLRLFMGAWKFAFAVQENDRRSLQFFGKDGEAVHKIYLTDRSDVSAYETLVEKYKAGIQGEAIQTEPIAVPAETPDSEIDVSGFQQAWLALQDTHDFSGMLRKFGVGRRQSMRLAPEGHATPLTVASVKRIVEGASERDLDIMVFIGSRGCIQIHTGKTKKLLQAGPWFNVLDPEFNMHLREEAIADVWLVKKPTVDGIVTSIEAFDANGNIIVQLFGKRKPHIPEREDWRQAVRDYTVAAV